MYANDDNTVAVVTFSGEDDYGEGKEFSCSIRICLVRSLSSQGVTIIPLKQE